MLEIIIRVSVAIPSTKFLQNLIFILSPEDLFTGEYQIVIL